MKKCLNILVLISLLFLVASCKDKSNSSTPSQGSQISSQLKTDNSNSQSGSTTKQYVHLLQVTALNFLTDGTEQCNVKNIIFAVSELDNNISYTVCINSKVQLLLLSDRGIVSYKAINLKNWQTLSVKLSETTAEYYELGKMTGLTRYAVHNPYGITSLAIEDVTDVSPELLKKYNDLNDRLSQLKEEVLLAKQNGTSLDPQIYEEILKLQ